MYVLSHNHLERSNLDFKVLLPLIKQTAQKLEGENPIMWQTGPAKRGDMKIVEKQLKMLDGSDIEEVYRLLSDFIMTKL